MQIYPYTNSNLSYPQKLPGFGSRSTQYRREYSKRLADNTVSETNINNLRSLSERFSDMHLTYDECKNAAKRNPFMLCHKPETMEQNIRETAKRLAPHGLTGKEYLTCAIQQPQLFSKSPETITRYIADIAEIFGPVGLTEENYISICKTNPGAFGIKPETLRKKVNQITEGINCSYKDICDLYRKQTRTINFRADEIIKKYKLLEFIEQNKAFDNGSPIPTRKKLRSTVFKKNFTNSNDLNFLILLRNKISNKLPRGQKIREKNIKENLTTYLQKNKNKILEITFPENEFTKEFQKLIRDFSKSVTGKNVFRVKIV